MSQDTVPLRRDTFKNLHRQHNLWRWAFSSLLAVLFMVFVCFFWFQWVKLGNDSMAPTFHKGDLVLVDRLYKYYAHIERTDMVAFYRPGTDQLLIKRVVATAGETVSGQSGAIWIDEKYRLEEEEYGAVHLTDFDTLTVPDGCVFVLSDDRQYLEDSREEGIGCVFLDDIVGDVHIRLLPSFTLYR